MKPVIISEALRASLNKLSAQDKDTVDSALQNWQAGKALPMKNLGDERLYATVSKNLRLDIQDKDGRLEVQRAHRINDRDKEAENELVISYMFLRKLVGVLGIALPVALAVFPQRPTALWLGLEPSISDYYYTDRGDFLVVLLSILGIFLFTYRGYELLERVLLRVAAIGAFGVAFVPTLFKCEGCASGVHVVDGGVFAGLGGEKLHLLCAGAFLLSLAVISIRYFPRTAAATKQAIKGTRKAKRNAIFKICGYAMIACVAALAVYIMFLPTSKTFPVIYVFETIAVWAFGISWLAKGEILFPDKKEGRSLLHFGTA